MWEHPYLDLFGSVLMELTVTGLLILALLRESVASFSFAVIGGGLLLLGLFDRLVTRKSISLGKYIFLNIIPAGAFLAAVFLTAVFVPEETGLLEYLFFFGFTGGAAVRRIYLGASEMQEMSRIVRVDLLVCIFILVRIWHHFASSEASTLLSLISLAALVIAVVTLTLERLKDSSSEKAPGTPALVMVPISALFTLLLGGAVIWGERISGLIMGAFLFVVGLIRRLLSFIAGLIWRFLVWLSSLLPDAEPMEMEMKEPTVLEKLVEEGPEPDMMVSWVILGITLILVLYFVLRAAFRIMLTRTGGRRVTAKNERRRSHLREAFLLLLVRIKAFGRSVWLLFFRGNTIPGLVARAEWFGRRRLAPRRRGETMREYLCRLEEKHYTGGMSDLLASYADRYYYAERKPFVSREDIRRMKKAYPVLPGK